MTIGHKLIAFVFWVQALDALLDGIVWLGADKGPLWWGVAFLSVPAWMVFGWLAWQRRIA